MDTSLHSLVQQLYMRHSEVISDDQLEDWPTLFTQDCFYRLTSRTNFDRSLPLGTILCESRGALVDRVTAIRHTMVYEPRRVLHTTSNVHLISIESDGILIARSMFCIWQTMADGQTRMQMVGRSFDKLHRSEQDGALRFAERIAVFDTELVPGSIVYPI